MTLRMYLQYGAIFIVVCFIAQFYEYIGEWKGLVNIVSYGMSNIWPVVSYFSASFFIGWALQNYEDKKYIWCGIFISTAIAFWRSA